MEILCSSKFSAERNKQSSKRTLFFCGGKEGNLHIVSTIWLDTKLQHCARILEDSFLLGKLSAGDMVVYWMQYILQSTWKLFIIENISNNKNTFLAFDTEVAYALKKFTRTILMAKLSYYHEWLAFYGKIFLIKTKKHLKQSQYSS